jgi:hypothetical protein
MHPFVSRKPMILTRQRTAPFPRADLFRDRAGAGLL